MNPIRSAAAVKHTNAALDTLGEIHTIMQDLPTTCAEAWSKILQAEKLMRRFFNLTDRLPVTFVVRSETTGEERIVVRYEILDHGRTVQKGLKDARGHVEKRCPKKLMTGLNGWV